MLRGLRRAGMALPSPVNLFKAVGAGWTRVAAIRACNQARVPAVGAAARRSRSIWLLLALTRAIPPELIASVLHRRDTIKEALERGTLIAVKKLCSRVAPADCRDVVLVACTPPPHIMQSNGPPGSPGQRRRRRTATVLHALVYPVTARVEVTDATPELEVSDPYRWLENLDSEVTRQWVRGAEPAVAAAPGGFAAARVGEAAADANCGTTSASPLR